MDFEEKFIRWYTWVNVHRRFKFYDDLRYVKGIDMRNWEIRNDLRGVEVKKRSETEGSQKEV